MGHVEVLIAGLLIAVAGLAALARTLSIPYPIVLVLGGALIGFVPGLPTVALDPDVVLVIFLPPLLYWAAFSANVSDLRANLRTLTLNSVGLVLITMSAVAVLAHEFVPGLSWAAAFVLGSIVSPTDPLAAGLIMRRLGAPRRLVSTVEGEGLVNDATALVAYRVSVSAVIGGSFSLVNAGLEFVVGAAGGIAIGFGVGWIVTFIRKRVTDIQVGVTLSLLSGYVAFIPANALGASAVLATVTTGLYAGIRGVSVLPARTRLQGMMVWDILNFLINAIIFVLVGLQLRSVMDGLSGHSPTALIGYALGISAVVIVVRMIWFFSLPYLIRMLDRRPNQRLRRVGPRPRFVVAWSGMRGSVSLAAAMALPLTVGTGSPFPERDLILFLTFAVIFSTLVVQGLSLPAVIRFLRIAEDGAEAKEELRARLEATRAALAQIEVLAELEWTREDSVDRMRRAYEYRKRRLAAQAGKDDGEDYEDRSLHYQQMVQAVLAEQRSVVVRMRNRGEISSEVMIRVIRDFDLEESRLEI